MLADHRTDIARIRGRLLTEPEEVADRGNLVPDWAPVAPITRPPVDAAVLIALVRRAGGYSVLFTERAADMRAHSGQISFPGGKIDPQDKDAAWAALREAHEEVQLEPGDAEILGFLPAYYTGSNYLITPVVALVEPRHDFVPNPLEVADLFEVPLPMLADAKSYGRHHVSRGGRAHSTWRIDFEGRVIWGITANLTRRFFEVGLGGER